MNSRFFRATALTLLLLPFLSAPARGDFDERLWERYIPLESPAAVPHAGFGGVWLAPENFGGPPASPPLADLRILSDDREEVPYRVDTKRPLSKTRVLIAETVNIAVTPQRATFVEAHLAEPVGVYDTVEIITSEKDFFRQVDVLGSSNGKSWNEIRRNAVVFADPTDPELRRLDIAMPPSSFPHLAIKVLNGDQPVLAVQGLRVLHQEKTPGAAVRLPATTVKVENDFSQQETRVILRLNASYPVSRVTLDTPDLNFRRMVRIERKGEGGEWVRVGEETVFDISTERVQERHLDVALPDVAGTELRLRIDNHDSPPLHLSGFRVFGWKRLLVFRLTGASRYYLFHGNPRARAPVYDMPQLPQGQDEGNVIFFNAGKDRPNTRFAGEQARLPFTERYRYAIYVAFLLLIAGLVALQWRVFREGKGSPPDDEGG
jgi:hypothetical protein